MSLVGRRSLIFGWLVGVVVVEQLHWWWWGVVMMMRVVKVDGDH
jgi:hypothetical protein